MLLLRFLSRRETFGRAPLRARSLRACAPSMADALASARLRRAVLEAVLVQPIVNDDFPGGFLIARHPPLLLHQGAPSSRGVGRSSTPYLLEQCALDIGAITPAASVQVPRMRVCVCGCLTA